MIRGRGGYKRNTWYAYISPYVCTPFCFWLSLLLDVPPARYCKKPGHWSRRRFLILDRVCCTLNFSINVSEFLVPPGSITLTFLARALAYGMLYHERTGSVLVLFYPVFVLVFPLLSRSLLLIVDTKPERGSVVSLSFIFTNPPEDN